MSGFKKFLMRGNLIDLAVAVVIGVAFNAIVQALVADVITPLISAAGGSSVTFSKLSVTIGKHSTIAYGLVLNSLFSFIIIALVVYYLLVAPADRLTSRLNRNKAATERQCPECLSEIAVGARRCMYCTATVEPIEPPASVPPPRRARHGQSAPTE
jgi:large conductance mechanosensitive channel